MKRFIADNSAALKKFILTHIVMSLLGIMLGLAILAFEGESESISALAIIGSVFTVGFMCFLHYDDMYFVGAKIAVGSHNEEEKKSVARGVKITLLAYSPVIFVGVLTSVLDIATNHGEPATKALFVYYAVQGSYLALYKLRVAWGVTVYVVLTLIPAFVASVLGYYMGLKEKTLRGLLGFKVKPPYDGPMPDKKNRWFRS
ncbi:MAG: hypothetical protein IKX92_04920 [Clostridia bacterium]|nr:hypothetical protein [Clostridia bacterium]